MTETISGTQLDHWRRCQRLYHYAHDRRLQPVELPWPIALGRVGHGILATYYSGLQLGMDHRSATEEAVGTATFNRDVLGHDATHIGYVLPLLGQYWATHAGDGGYRVLAVEQQVGLDFGPWNYVGTVDTVMQRVAGDELEVWDHRFLYDFYGIKMALLDQQLPRYVMAAEVSLGRPVARAVRNMVSTAPLAQLAKANRNRVKRLEVPVGDLRRQVVTRDMHRTASEILAWRQLDLPVRSLLATRTVIPGERYPSCGSCMFLDLCSAEAHGLDTTALVAERYTASDYRYEEATA